MGRCKLCYAFTHNRADYVVTFGNEERELCVCKWCLQDLMLLGFKANKVVRLTRAKPCNRAASGFIGLFLQTEISGASK
jgi:hypothetical protein